MNMLWSTKTPAGIHCGRWGGGTDGLLRPRGSAQDAAARSLRHVLAAEARAGSTAESIRERGCPQARAGAQFKTQVVYL